MAVNNEQMRPENIIKRGVRGDQLRIVKLPVPGMVRNIMDLCKIDVGMILESVTTWEDFVQVCKTSQLHGWTRFTDHHIIALYFKNGLSMNAAAKDIGYATGRNGTNAGSALKFRLRRINAENIYLVILPFIKKGLLPMETIREILTIKDSYTAKEQSIRRSEMFKYYTSRFVKEGVAASAGSTEVFANFTGVEESDIIYWNMLEAEDVMVKPK